MACEFRVATLADMAAVDAVLARSYPKLLKADYPPSVLVTALPRISRAQPELLSSGTYFVAEDEGQVLAAGGWTLDRREAQKGHIRHVVTDDRHLRRRLAARILERCFETSAARGVRELECWSTHTAEAFYGAMGFERIEPMDVQLGQGIMFPAVRMRRVSEPAG